ncbi:hypothetical protein [Microbacterium sp. Marseille-Q6965]|uniref:hypothetical protein n=1 Tax=Microbacterium sp. Marseille-Q6965 TaxID=2965072 RepID=UPI0021B72A57|nr:hypothetical protein [Microbacterium sp. Marseille-Q6965]
MLLVESFGDEDGSFGQVSARLWIAATDLVVELPLGNPFFGSDGWGDYKARTNALAAAEAEVRAIDALGLEPDDTNKEG